MSPTEHYRQKLASGKPLSYAEARELKRLTAEALNLIQEINMRMPAQCKIQADEFTLAFGDVIDMQLTEEEI